MHVCTGPLLVHPGSPLPRQTAKLQKLGTAALDNLQSPFLSLHFINLLQRLKKDSHVQEHRIVCHLPLQIF